MALNDILTSMDGARDALVTAINAKGGSLAQDSTLYQCANAVNEISTGTDTSDVTATASDILQDKTAYAKDEKITDTIPTVTASMSDNVVTVPKGYVKSAQTLTVGTALNAFTITPAANAQVISKGSYLKGEVTVAGDTNLTAANIKSGVTIFNVAGTYEGESTGGTSAEYYKCASVTPGTDVPEGATFTMSYTLKAFDGTFTYNWTMDDTSKIGTERTWSGTVNSEPNNTSVLKINSAGFWQITDGLGETTAQAISNNPWEIADWHNADGGDVSCTYSNISEAVSGTDTWSGYKAVFDSTAGTWSFESEVTDGLAYTNVTPIVGSIYSADALVKVEYLYTSASFFDGFTFEDQLASTNGYLSLEESPTPVYVEHDNGKALSFDGSGGRDLTGFDFIKNEFKIEFDFKIDSWSTDSSWKGNASRIFGAGNRDNTVFTFEAYKSNGEIKTCGFYTGFIVQQATWYHASVEYKNNKLTVTFDSNTVSFDYNPDLSITQTYVNLGGSTFDNFYLLTGAIDNFNLYTFKA